MGGKTTQARTTIYLDHATLDKLKAISERTMIPMCHQGILQVGSVAAVIMLGKGPKSADNPNHEDDSAVDYEDDRRPRRRWQYDDGAIDYDEAVGVESGRATG